jgi:large subunit ribosomal protein L31
VKTDIHPDYGATEVVCSCGNAFVTRSTAGESLHVELCNECHPFFTGKQKLVDSGGRVERFQRRYGKTSFTPGDATPAPVPEAPVIEEQPEASDEAAADADAEEASEVAEEASEAEA